MSNNDENGALNYDWSKVDSMVNLLTYCINKVIIILKSSYTDSFKMIALSKESRMPQLCNSSILKMRLIHTAAYVTARLMRTATLQQSTQNEARTYSCILKARLLNTRMIMIHKL